MIREGGISVRGCDFAFGAVDGLLGRGAHEIVDEVGDNAALSFGDGARLFGLLLLFEALMVVFAGVEVLGVAAGAFAHGGGDEAAKLAEEFGFYVEGQIGLAGFEEGLEELEGMNGFDSVVEGRDA